MKKKRIEIDGGDVARKEIKWGLPRGVLVT